MVRNTAPATAVTRPANPGAAAANPPVLISPDPTAAGPASIQAASAPLPAPPVSRQLWPLAGQPVPSVALPDPAAAANQPGVVKSVALSPEPTAPAAPTEPAPWQAAPALPLPAEITDVLAPAETALAPVVSETAPVWKAAKTAVNPVTNAVPLFDQAEDALPDLAIIDLPAIQGEQPSLVDNLSLVTQRLYLPAFAPAFQNLVSPAAVALRPSDQPAGAFPDGMALSPQVGGVDASGQGESVPPASTGPVNQLPARAGIPSLAAAIGSLGSEPSEGPGALPAPIRGAQSAGTTGEAYRAVMAAPWSSRCCLPCGRSELRTGSRCGYVHC